MTVVNVIAASGLARSRSLTEPPNTAAVTLQYVCKKQNEPVGTPPLGMFGWLICVALISTQQRLQQRLHCRKGSD